jgi:uncharacterized membrane protein YozB (DUF420 family)
MLKFLQKNWFLMLAVAVLGSLAFGADAFADVNDLSTGPFQKFLQRAGHLFQVSRNALFVVAAFMFIGFAWNAIQSGEIEWKKIAYLLIGLVLLGVAGFVVTYIANPNSTAEQLNSMQENYRLQDTGGWGTDPASSNFGVGN